MQAYNIEHVADESILIISFTDAYESKQHRPLLNSDVWDLLEDTTEALCIILLVSYEVVTLEMILETAKIGTQGAKPVFTHPNFRRLIYVSDNLMLKAAVKTYQGDIFGKIKAVICDSLEEALAYCRAYPNTDSTQAN